MMGPFFKIGIGVGMIATIPSSDSTELWAQWGLAGIVIGYVLWNNTTREKRMNAMIEANNKWVRETLVAALDKATKALEKVCGRREGEPR